MNTYVIQFVIDPSDGNYGKIVIVVTTGLDPTSSFKFEITGPDGVIYALPATPDLFGSGGTFTVDIPVDSDGNWLEGAYTFRVQADEFNDGSVDLDVNNTYTWAVPADNQAALSLDVKTDCFAKYLIIDDTTAYVSTDTVTKSIVVDYPVISGETNIGDTTHTTTPVSISLVRSSGKAYENVIYAVTAHIHAVTAVETSGAWSYTTLYAYADFAENHLVQCNKDVCGVISCIESKYSSLLDLACKTGGLRALSREDADTLMLLQSYIALYNFYVQCQDSDKVAEYYGKIKELVGDCNCPAPTGPVEIEESNIIYLRGRSAYEVWLDAGNTGSVDDFFNSLFPVGEWIEVPDAQVSSNFDKLKDNPPMYRITKTHLEFKGGVTETFGAIPFTTGFTLFSAAFDPFPVLEEVRVPIWNYDNGTHAALLYKDTDGAWKVQFGLLGDWDQAGTMVLAGQMPLDGVATVATAEPAIPVYTDWVEFPAAQYRNSFAQVVGNELSWRTDGRFVYFKGAFDGSTWPSSGLKIFDAAYFTSSGIELQVGAAVPIAETDATGNQADVIGFLKVEANGDLYVYQSALVTAPFNDVIVCGVLALNE